MPNKCILLESNKFAVLIFKERILRNDVGVENFFCCPSVIYACRRADRLPRDWGTIHTRWRVLESVKQTSDREGDPKAVPCESRKG